MDSGPEYNCSVKRVLGGLLGSGLVGLPTKGMLPGEAFAISGN